jgi:hypothetical protein
MALSNRDDCGASAKHALVALQQGRGCELMTQRNASMVLALRCDFGRKSYTELDSPVSYCQSVQANRS